jgi:hypothetical protein
MIIYWDGHYWSSQYPLDSDTNFFLVKSGVVAFNEEGPRWVKKDWVRHRTEQTQIHGVEDHGSVW